jgi:DNA polymerase I-like protein with 3'-5' exonuclease and polymerase domains/uracil-DNA glycosylase
MKKTGTKGPRNARVMVVAEAPGRDEDLEGIPLVGNSGQESDRMLSEVGFPCHEIQLPHNLTRLEFDDIFFTNVCKYRPPGNEIDFFIPKKKKLVGNEVRLHDKLVHPLLHEGYQELRHDVESINPNVIIAYGNVSMWALTAICGNIGRQAPPTGITDWRGSQLTASGLGRPNKVIPTYHPAGVLRMWHWRGNVIRDLSRAKREAEDASFRLPPWKFEIRPSYDTAINRLDWLLVEAQYNPLPLSVDLETRKGHIACTGLAWSNLDAICIPLIDVKKPDWHYWTLEQEQQIVLRLRNLLHHPNVRVIGQNFLYDLQYLIRFWGINPKVAFDTMLGHHICFPGTPKGLGYLSSMYCDFHQYWKDEGKDFDPYKHDEERLWNYNCRDAIATFECATEIHSVIKQLNREEQFKFQQYDLYPAVLGMMLRGVYIDRGLRGALSMEVLGHASEREAMINFFAQRPINPRSPKQLQDFVYHEMGQKVIKNRDSGNPTTDDDALDLVGKREPLLRRFCGAVNEVRTLGAAINVLRSPLDLDGYMRCSYNIAGPETFRFSSSESAYGTGTNFQNITSGRISEYTGLQLPNMRRLMIPPYGSWIAEGDLDRADLQVVVWESEDDELKFALRTGLDLHLLNAGAIFGIKELNSERLLDPEFVKYAAAKYYTQRQVAKIFCHATNYGGKARTVSAHCGLTVYETEVMQNRWFGSHPGIKQWHRRTDLQLQTTRSVQNRFGYVRFYFDRIEECLPEALAWVPQSTVAITINKILVNLHRHCRHLVTLRLQVHDSLVFDYPDRLHPSVFDQILPHTRIPIPYPDPLIIPVSFKASPVSWGLCKPLELKPSNPALNATT